MATFEVELQTDSGTFVLDVEAPEGTPEADIQAAARQQFEDSQSGRFEPVYPQLAGETPLGVPVDLMRSTPVPGQEIPPVTGYGPGLRPITGIRQTRESRTPLEALRHATAGEALRLGLGAKSIAQMATGQFPARRETLGQHAALEAEQTERFSEFPISTFAGQMAPYMGVPNVAYRTLPRATATGAALGGVGSAMDPWQTAFGAGAGAGGFALGRALARPESQLNPFQQRALQEGRELGISPTPAQETGGPLMQMLENSLESNALTAGATLRSAQKFQKVANRTAARSIGEPGDVVDDLVLGSADERIGGVFKRVGEKATAPLDDRFLDDLARVEDEMIGAIDDPDTEKMISKVITRVMDRAGEDNTLTGKQLTTFSSRLKKRARALLRGEKPDPDLAFAFNGIADAMDDLLSRNVSPLNAAQLADAKTQWRNLVFLEQPGVVRGGQVSVRVLANVLARRARQEYKRGGRHGTASPTDQLFAVARYGEAFPQTPSSGTAQRMSVPVAGSALGMGAAATGDLFTGAALGLGGPALLSRLYGRYPFVTGIFGLPTAMGNPLGELGARGTVAYTSARQERQR